MRDNLAIFAHYIDYRIRLRVVRLNSSKDTVHIWRNPRRLALLRRCACPNPGWHNFSAERSSGSYCRPQSPAWHHRSQCRFQVYAPLAQSSPNAPARARRRHLLPHKHIGRPQIPRLRRQAPDGVFQTPRKYSAEKSTRQSSCGNPPQEYAPTTHRRLPKSAFQNQDSRCFYWPFLLQFSTE